MQDNRFLPHQLLPNTLMLSNPNHAMFEGVKLMHKNWVIKGYDQSVTCLADDPRNLETRSSTLRTPGILSQTNNIIHKHSTRSTGKTQIIDLTRKFNLRTPVCKKKSNQTKQQNSNCERNKIR